MIKELKKVKSGKSLNETEMTRVMTLIMNGECTDDNIAEFLKTLAYRGETVDEITGAAKVLRQKASHINAPENAIDCCGTGGDQKGTYNVSTAVSLVTASCGVPVAKHGNRASSSKSGTADVLEALGVNLNMTKEKLEEALHSLNFAFLMAPQHHGAMKHVSHIRKKLGIRTIFNLIGPLANPADTKYQLIGVFDKKWLRPMAETLKKLGSHKAWIANGFDGLDEITVTDQTHIAKLDKDGAITETIVTPKDFGIPFHHMDDLLGDDAKTNAAALSDLLNGKQNAYRDITLVNTAATLIIAEKVNTLKEGVEMAKQNIDSGAAKNLLGAYIQYSNRT